MNAASLTVAQRAAFPGHVAGVRARHFAHVRHALLRSRFARAPRAGVVLPGLPVFVEVSVG